MKIQAGERRSVPYMLFGDIVPFREHPEDVASWIFRRLDEAKRTSLAHPLRDLQVVVGTEIYDELLRLVADFPPSVTKALNQIYGAELVVDHTLPVPFEVRWTTDTEAAITRLLRRAFPPRHYDETEPHR